jgi:hypothetical protein
MRQIRVCKDIISLERDIRMLLQCQGRQCAFLQSAEYAALKISMYHALRELPPSKDMRLMNGQVIYIPGSTLYIQVGEDGLSLLIQSKAVAIVPPTNTEPAAETPARRHVVGGGGGGGGVEGHEVYSQTKRAKTSHDSIVAMPPPPPPKKESPSAPLLPATLKLATAPPEKVCQGTPEKAGEN